MPQLFFDSPLLRLLPYLSAMLVLLAIAMLWNHQRRWRLTAGRPMDAAERDYRVSQFRRRTQTATLLALIGICMFVGYWVEPRAHPRVFGAIWLGVMLITLWMIGLAMFDAIETGRYFSRISRRR